MTLHRSRKARRTLPKVKLNRALNKKAVSTLIKTSLLQKTLNMRVKESIDILITSRCIVVCKYSMQYQIVPRSAWLLINLVRMPAASDRASCWTAGRNQESHYQNLILAEIRLTKTTKLRRKTIRNPASNSHLSSCLSSTQASKANRSYWRTFVAVTSCNKSQVLGCHVSSNHAQDQGRTPRKPVLRTM